MRKLLIVKLMAGILLVFANPVISGQERIQKYIFQNDMGDRIIITSEGATIGKKLYSSKNCSTGSFRCVKYGSIFAIVAPLSCNAIQDYKWHVDGVDSFILALSPHNPHDVLLSTSYGGFVAFGYGGKGGVTYLFYDPSVRIGIIGVWRKIEHVELEKLRYKKVFGGRFFPCL